MGKPETSITYEEAKRQAEIADNQPSLKNPLRNVDPNFDPGDAYFEVKSLCWLLQESRAHHRPDPRGPEPAVRAPGAVDRVPSRRTRGPPHSQRGPPAQPRTG